MLHFPWKSTSSELKENTIVIEFGFQMEEIVKTKGNKVCIQNYYYYYFLEYLLEINKMKLNIESCVYL